MGSCSSKSNEVSPSTPKDSENDIIDTCNVQHETKAHKTPSQNTKRFKNADTESIIRTQEADSKAEVRSVGQEFDRGQSNEVSSTTPKDRGNTTGNISHKTKTQNNHIQHTKGFENADNEKKIETHELDSHRRNVEQKLDRTSNQEQTDKKSEKLIVRNGDKLIEVTLGNREVVADVTYMSPEPPKLRKADLLKDTTDFTKIDQHAREAPLELVKDIPDLVGYLSIPSKDPLCLIRSIFVWVAYNIDYDADGYFGRAEKSQCDSSSVLKSGKSVCEGYANVIQELCNQAGIAVKKLSGFAKGFSHSIKTRFTLDCKTNHAWNAVCIRGNWFLLDSTWGAGNVNRETKQFVRKFNEFYFLTDPEHFIYSHFPICKGSAEESLKWQLLDSPFSLRQFNDAMKIQPAAFDLGILPYSHKESVIEFADEVEMAFIETVPQSHKLTMKLYLKDGNKLHQEEYCCFAFWSSGTLNIKVKPPKTGTYELKIHGRELKADNNESSPQLFSYLLNCNVPRNVMTSRRYPYPEAYPQAYLDECDVIEPLGKQLLPHSNVTMRFRSPLLKRMMIKKTMLEKAGDTFVGSVLTPESGDVITVYGSRLESGSLKGMFKFCVG